MADAIDFENLQLIFKDYKDFQSFSQPVSSLYNVVHIGQVVHMQLICTLSEATRNKIKKPSRPHSPVSLNVIANLKRQLASAFDVKCAVRGVCRRHLQHEEACKDVALCRVTACHQGEWCSENMKNEGFLSEDKQFYHVPVNIRILDIPSCCKKAEIFVHVRPSSKFGPAWLSSPTNPESPSFEDPESPSQNTGKTVSQIVRVIHPPEVSVHQNHIGNQEIIFLQVKNISNNPMSLAECKILPDSCPKTAAGSQYCTSKPDSKRVCIVHANMVKMILSDDTLLPMQLRPGERVSLCYTLNLTQCEASFQKDDVVLEAHVKWNIPGNNKNSKHTAPVTTVYRLHSLRVKKGLFVMSATCDDVCVKKGQSFTVTYTIHNRLQDFLAIKLHWSPVLAEDSIESMRNFERIETSLICHDPSIQLGSCQYGDTVEAKISFYALSKGLYEVCKHMKINLRYLIPASDNTSLASPTSQGSAISDDHLSVIPDQLWRTRSGSGSSVSLSHPLSDGRRMSSTSKSLSFGDLGPDNTADTELFQKPKSDKSPVLLRRDPRLNVCPSKYEQMLLSPGNFIKNSCLVRVE